MRLGVLTDLHLREGGAGAWHNQLDFAGVQERFAGALERFAGVGVDAIALLGDLSDDEDRERALEAVARAGSATGLPVLAVAGNHDAPGLGAALAASNLESAQALGAELVPTPVSDGTVVALELRDPATMLVLSHFPVLALQGELERRGLKYAGDHPRRDALARWLDHRAGPALLLAGHLHVRAAFPDGPRLHLQLGPLIEHPYDATLVEIHDAGLRLTATSLPGAAWETETRLAPGDAAWHEAGGRWMTA
jgi:predicted phosphodiesterase